MLLSSTYSPFTWLTYRYTPQQDGIRHVCDVWVCWSQAVWRLACFQSFMPASCFSCYQPCLAMALKLQSHMECKDTIQAEQQNLCAPLLSCKPRGQQYTPWLVAMFSRMGDVN